MVSLTSEWPFPVLFSSLFITIIIIYSILSFVSWSSATATIFGNKSLVWFLLISQRTTHQIACIATWTGVLNDEACFLFFSCFFFLTSYLSYLMILYLISMLLWFCSTFDLSPCFYFCCCSFFLPCLFLVLLYPFCSAFEVSLFLPCSDARSSTCLFISLFYKKNFFWGGICEADVWEQHGSVRRVMGSETLNTSARLTLLTVPGWVGQCARLANDYQAQLSPAGTKS